MARSISEEKSEPQIAATCGVFAVGFLWLGGVLVSGIFVSIANWRFGVCGAAAKLLADVACLEQQERGWRETVEARGDERFDGRRKVDLVEPHAQLAPRRKV